MVPLLHRQPFRTIYLLSFSTILVFIQVPYWLVYYSWRPNRPRKTWTLRRTIMTRIVRKFALLPFKVGILTSRDLALEVPQKELKSYNARFVWVPELERGDIVGMVGEYAAKAGVESIAIPAYWILKDGTEWSPAHERARKDEKVILYLHGGAFVVRSVSSSYPVFVLIFVTDGDCTSISLNSVYSQGNTPIFNIHLSGTVGRLPTQFHTPFGIKEPIPSCSHRCNRSIQVPCLRARIPASEYHHSRRVCGW